MEYCGFCLRRIYKCFRKQRIKSKRMRLFCTVILLHLHFANFFFKSIVFCDEIVTNSLLLHCCCCCCCCLWLRIVYLSRLSHTVIVFCVLTLITFEEETHSSLAVDCFCQFTKRKWSHLVCVCLFIFHLEFIATFCFLSRFLCFVCVSFSFTSPSIDQNYIHCESDFIQIYTGYLQR